jgi:hypothetical protein
MQKIYDAGYVYMNQRLIHGPRGGLFYGIPLLRSIKYNTILIKLIISAPIQIIISGFI